MSIENIPVEVTIIDTLQYAVEYMCGETAASGFAIMGIYISSRLCPRRVSEKKVESFVGASVTHVRKPTLFSFDISEKARETFAITGMLDQKEALSMVSADVLADLSEEERDGLIVELQFQCDSNRPQYRTEILNTDGDISIFMNDCGMREKTK